MKSLRYLNLMLTLIAVLLAAHLYTLWTMTSGIAASAQAQVQSSNAPAGVPNAGAQRQEMISILRQLVNKTEEVNNTLRSGQMRVQVEKGSDDKK